MRILLVFLLLHSLIGYSQEEDTQQLAQYYYSKGEFVKALSYCEASYNQVPSKFTFIRYYTCLLQT